MILGQNTEQYIEFMVCDEDGAPLDTSLFTKVEFTFDTEKSKNQVIKYWPTNSEVQYNVETKIFTVLLTEEETCNWTHYIPVQIRVWFTNGTIDSTDQEIWDIRPCLHRRIMKND